MGLPEVACNKPGAEGAAVTSDCHQHASIVEERKPFSEKSRPFGNGVDGAQGHGLLEKEKARLTSQNEAMKQQIEDLKRQHAEMNAKALSMDATPGCDTAVTEVNGIPVAALTAQAGACLGSIMEEEVDSAETEGGVL